VYIYFCAVSLIDPPRSSNTGSATGGCRFKSLGNLAGRRQKMIYAVGRLRLDFCSIGGPGDGTHSARWQDWK
jgi:hypothetical protein